MEKLKVIKDKCIGCGMCVGQNPSYFTFDDEGQSKVLNENVNPNDKKDILESIEMCPTEAILIEEEK